MKPKPAASCSSRYGTRSKEAPTDFAGYTDCIICVICENRWPMLQFLNISNIALIDDMQVEFESGLNLLTGETGSGKSIIVDALGVLDRRTVHQRTTQVQALNADRSKDSFLSRRIRISKCCLKTPGLAQTNELIIRRELSSTGRNKIFINNQLATQSLLRDLRPYLVDIHGQGDQQTLFNPETHLEILDAFAGNGALRTEVAEAYQRWNAVRRELDSLRHDEAEKFQLVDTLKFQIAELERAQLSPGKMKDSKKSGDDWRMLKS
jgi:DNA repair protein RecN (Recombination protein N)